jgi:hypothetical protein
MVWLFAALHSFPIRSFAMTPLRQRMLEDMSIRNLAENAQLSYLQQVSAYARYFGRSPEALGPEDVRTYQVHLVEVRKLSPASVGIATSRSSATGHWRTSRCPRNRSGCRSS